MLLKSILFFALASTACSLMAAEQVADPGDSAAVTREEALAHERVGLAAMQEASNNNSNSRIVDAAMEFSAALNIFEPLQDFEKCQEMKADIFWCKKRMNLDDLNSYLARKHNDKQVAANYETILAVADKKIAPEESEAYFARAKKYADENADKPFQVAIRYFEVAERFVGSDVAIKAQRLSLEAQEAHMRAIGTGAKVARETLFNSPAKPVEGVQAPIPNSGEQKEAQAAVKKLFKDDGSVTKKQKEALAKKYLAIAKEGKEDAKIRFALLGEAVNYAQQAGNIYAIVTIIDETARQFKGYDVATEKKVALGKIKSQEAAAAALKLLDDPADKDANSKAGKYICLMAEQWDSGLPLLASGADEKLAKVAEMELQNPSGAMQEMEVGDQWYEIGSKATPTYKEALWIRSRHWYKMALPGLQAVSKQKVDQRLDEIWGLSLDPDADYNSLTAAQWEKLKCSKCEVNCTKQINDPGLTLKAGQRVRVIPHPTDTWTGRTFSGNGSVTYNWKGAIDSPLRFTQGGLPYMALECWVENGKKEIPHILEGPGKVLLGVEDPFGIAQTGTIHVKLLPLDE